MEESVLYLLMCLGIFYQKENHHSFTTPRVCPTKAICWSSWYKSLHICALLLLWASSSFVTLVRCLSYLFDQDHVLHQLNFYTRRQLSLCKKWPIVTCTKVTCCCCTSHLLSGWSEKMMHVTFYLLVSSLKRCSSPLLWYRWRATSKHVTFVIDDGPWPVTYKFDIGDGQH